MDGVWFVIAALLLLPVLYRIADSLDKISKNTTITKKVDGYAEVTMGEGTKYKVKL